MKTILIALLSIQLCLFPGVLAEIGNPPSFPPPSRAPEASEAPEISQTALENALSLTVGGQTVSLAFDDNPTFSQITEGMVQASFFSDLSQNPLYEMYLLFPDGVTENSVISSSDAATESADKCGLMLFVTTASEPKCYSASQVSGSSFPASSEFTIHFTEVTAEGSSVTYRGTLESAMVGIDSNYNPTSDSLSVRGEFSFTLNTDAQQSPGDPPDADDDKESDGGDLPQPETPPEIPNLPVVPTPPPTLSTPENAREI